MSIASCTLRREIKVSEKARLSNSRSDDCEAVGRSERAESNEHHDPEVEGVDNELIKHDCIGLDPNVTTSIEKKVVVDEDRAICSSSADRTGWQPGDLARRMRAWKCV